MLKLKHYGLLVLGLIPSELEHLKQGQPLTIKLDDVGLPGQGLVIVTGDNNDKLRQMAEEVAERLVKVNDEKKIVIADKVH